MGGVLDVLILIGKVLISIAAIALGISWGVRGQMRTALAVCAVLLAMGIFWTNLAGLLIPTILLAYMAGVLMERGWHRAGRQREENGGHATGG
ncbi:hypothetical protein Tmar_0230 [Thermaerobacter marianensis DSM 12885]|uniref:Uncharacterized protein n=1 Tax=Thermaerobacter marianensis (strain ATCC 700841 / DSM 12885 / JCM 10246 / 7p75a) TaxID=644966 RepID=E6SM25_THEM7|nr:hypothetical protein [Thermaerobacter marianensis]ADU50355.1 hypothetical protein Tmar_0230 [Thermaerobacter marianensis DSM 12885]